MAKVSSRYLLYFPAAMLVEHRPPPTWRLHAELSKFDERLAWSLENCRILKLGEVLSLPPISPIT